AEAASLRRIAGQLDALTRLTTATTTSHANGEVVSVKAAPLADPSTDAEIKRLKDALAKANAELDRIRKRLSQPPPPPP
ncbi:MAG TPA: hypothetical protein VHV78_03765, partial [Gemmatimonadaceae bacterium]|nr:hypothetical protein [Gemmatimonadaceae bacterium]